MRIAGQRTRSNPSSLDVKIPAELQLMGRLEDAREIAFEWEVGWDSADTNTGATQEEITAIHSKAKMFGRGDAGLFRRSRTPARP